MFSRVKVRLPQIPGFALKEHHEGQTKVHGKLTELVFEALSKLEYGSRTLWRSPFKDGTRSKWGSARFICSDVPTKPSLFCFDVFL